MDRVILRTLKLGRDNSFGSSPSTQFVEENDFFGFPSRVVSRMHAEIWYSDGEFYIRDTQSRSGTFLNAMRLSEPGRERYEK